MGVRRVGRQAVQGCRATEAVFTMQTDVMRRVDEMSHSLMADFCLHGTRVTHSPLCKLVTALNDKSLKKTHYYRRGFNYLVKTLKQSD